MTVSNRTDIPEANPAFICRLPSGYLTLGEMQFLRGYCILYADPQVADLNALYPGQRSQYLCDMTLVGDALLVVTGAYRINYGIFGNSQPILHAHIVPRYTSEPETLRKGLPWSYHQEMLDSNPFNHQSDQDLIQRIADTIRKRLEGKY